MLGERGREGAGAVWRGRSRGSVQCCLGSPSGHEEQIRRVTRRKVQSFRVPTLSNTSPLTPALPHLVEVQLLLGSALHSLLDSALGAQAVHVYRLGLQYSDNRSAGEE